MSNSCPTPAFRRRSFQPRGVPPAPASVSRPSSSLPATLSSAPSWWWVAVSWMLTSVYRACDDRSYQNQRAIYTSMRITPLPSLIQSTFRNIRTVPNHSGAPEANACGSSEFLDETDAGHATPHTHGSLCPRVNRKAAEPHCPHLPHINLDSMPWDILCHLSGQQSLRTSK